MIAHNDEYEEDECEYKNYLKEHNIAIEDIISLIKIKRISKLSPESNDFFIYLTDSVSRTYKISYVNTDDNISKWEIFAIEYF